jgi:hypothetical protein
LERCRDSSSATTRATVKPRALSNNSQAVEEVGAFRQHGVVVATHCGQRQFDAAIAAGTGAGAP